MKMLKDFREPCLPPRKALLALTTKPTASRTILDTAVHLRKASEITGACFFEPTENKLRNNMALPEFCVLKAEFTVP
jgi:hypothetical protein